jgi:hypothetical protein
MFKYLDVRHLSGGIEFDLLLNLVEFNFSKVMAFVAGSGVKALKVGKRFLLTALGN